MQYRWRCTFRDAYYVCLLIWPWAHTQSYQRYNQIMEHYADKEVQPMVKTVNYKEIKLSDVV